MAAPSCSGSSSSSTTTNLLPVDFKTSLACRMELCRDTKSNFRKKAQQCLENQRLQVWNKGQPKKQLAECLAAEGAGGLGEHDHIVVLQR